MARYWLTGLFVGAAFTMAGWGLLSNSYGWFGWGVFAFAAGLLSAGGEHL